MSLLHLNKDPYGADQLILHIQAGQDLPLAAVNELVTTISRHFGVSQAVIVSAIFDESLSQSLKMCVLGKECRLLKRMQAYLKNLRRVR